ncbi:hypothetical protein LOY43_01820 [Pseudomonas sp. B21-041]|uniref:hypothetical protein n=1 Tax=Pseudomonas sp. B21-041 TaxID=2895487 RepID=UPI0021603573|nr:hypothetical protein [Pseudomonas sp. B21-041]UVL35186.1 hypothetical protein LOY43_01820 [Pseudomonas sp. B21-041]
MNTPNDQALAKEFFTATLIYPKEEKAFKASNVSITDDTTESGVKCWTITASEYTKDEKDGTVEIHTLLLYIKKASADHSFNGKTALGPALAFPDFKEDSAGYYILKDSPDDQDDDFDSILDSPGTEGELTYSQTPDSKFYMGSFSFIVKNPNNTQHTIKGEFNIRNAAAHVI